MPWEKSFDESDVVEQAMQVFWQKGYSATSISDITEATGVQRGSLYNAFDGKKELFLKSLVKYDTVHRKEQLAQLDQVDDPREAISIFFEACVKHSLDDPAKKGCLLVNTALDYSQHDDDVQKVVDGAIRDLLRFFERTIKRGQKNGHISQSVEPKPTAKGLVALLAGIRVLGRGTLGRNALGEIVQQAQRLIS